MLVFGGKYISLSKRPEMIQVVLIGKKKGSFQIYPLQTLILTDSNLKQSFKIYTNHLQLHSLKLTNPPWNFMLASDDISFWWPGMPIFRGSCFEFPGEWFFFLENVASKNLFLTVHWLDVRGSW